MNLGPWYWTFKYFFLVLASSKWTLKQALNDVCNCSYCEILNPQRLYRKYWGHSAHSPSADLAGKLTPQADWAAWLTLLPTPSSDLATQPTMLSPPSCNSVDQLPTRPTLPFHHWLSSSVFPWSSDLVALLVLRALTQQLGSPCFFPSNDSAAL